MASHINLERLMSDCDTGDLILYNTKCWYSKFIEYFSDSIYSHIGIILKDPTFINEKMKGLYVLESSYEDIADSNTGERIWGVQIIPLDYVINQYKTGSMGDLYYRKLDSDKNEEFYTNLKKSINEVEGDKYNLNPVDWCKALFKINHGDNHKKDTFWCSALVAYIYVSIGYLDEGIPWTILPPKAFSYYENISNPTLTYVNCKLHPEQKILL